MKSWLRSPTQNQSAGNDRQRQGRKQQADSRSGKQQGQPRAGSEGNQARRQGRSANPSGGEGQAADRAEAGNAGNKPDSSSERRRAENRSSGQRRNDAEDRDALAARLGQRGEQDKQTAMNDTQAPVPGDATQSTSESQQATAQWLRRIPDDPGGLWRRKFLYQYKREYQSQQDEARPW